MLAIGAGACRALVVLPFHFLEEQRKNISFNCIFCRFGAIQLDGISGTQLVNPEDFKHSDTGTLVPTIKGMAFVPHALPPSRALDLAPLLPIVARATKALGELSGIGRTVQNPLLLIRPFMRREAVASSKIEGTVTTLNELFLFEVDEQRAPTPGDAREVFNYVRALEFALKQLEELPVSSRLIKGAHEILLANVEKHRGSTIIPGEFRSDQNWIGARLQPTIGPSFSLQTI